MIYQAKIENGIVTNIIVAEDYFVATLEGTWISCTQETLPGIGFTYNEIEGFRPQKPYDSWIYNEEMLDWEAPAPHPNDGNIYEWNEANLTWKMIYLKVSDE